MFFCYYCYLLLLLLLSLLVSFISWGQIPQDVGDEAEADPLPVAPGITQWIPDSVGGFRAERGQRPGLT